MGFTQRAARAEDAHRADSWAARMSGALSPNSALTAWRYNMLCWALCLLTSLVRPLLCGHCPAGSPGRGVPPGKVQIPKAQTACSQLCMISHFQKHAKQASPQRPHAAEGRSCEIILDSGHISCHSSRNPWSWIFLTQHWLVRTAKQSQQYAAVLLFAEQWGTSQGVLISYPDSRWHFSRHSSHD